MSCSDCFHYGICLFHHTDEEYKKCVHFKPSADVVEVRHAYWKTVTEIRDNTVCGDGAKIQYTICSNCEKPMGLTGEDYCGCCGAKMDGERTEHE